MTLTLNNTRRQVTFADLKGFKAEGYIRDSTLDQRDGFGPELQRRAIEGFAQTWGLICGAAWYTDFITGTSTLKRSGFHQALADAQLGFLDVLLVYHTSRFARNRADAIRYKAELRKSGKILVFVSQSIISGNDNDYMNEGINELMDEGYSRNLSRYVTDGLRVKHEQGMANGVPPLGYKSEKLDSGKRERKVPDLNGREGDPKSGSLEALLTLLRCYAAGQFSYQTLADHLNAQGYSNREGEPFTKGSVEHVLANRFYEGKAIFHPGEPDEEIKDGTHEVPAEVKELWLKCQEVKRQRVRPGQYSSKREVRIYPFTGVLVCDICGKPYHGEAVKRPSGLYLRMFHYQCSCEVRPHSFSADLFAKGFGGRVLRYVCIDEGWRNAILAALAKDTPQADTSAKLRHIESAIANLRKQHLWGAISDDEFKQEFQALDREQRILENQQRPTQTPNLDRASALLRNLPELWQHPGVNDKKRRELVREVFQMIRLRGRDIISVMPKSAYAPLFAYALLRGNFVGSVGASGFEPPTSASRTLRAKPNCATPRKVIL